MMFSLLEFIGEMRNQQIANNLCTILSMKLKKIIENGLMVNDALKKVLIFVFSCDTPAKSFILKTKGH
ncbi:Uncharacterized protein FWK35_00018816 [Aphis craccivora]|uniref:Uncharacterized protein n=1 Tax=Aphis craccivora TaxID=307492 RepID=A0A6G0Y7E3_APHCR|nr:Uncharacterized protein FWK35_00018816 [Aphis craccivora]